MLYYKKTIEELTTNYFVEHYTNNNNVDWCVICVQEPTQSSQPAQDAAEAEREDKSHPGGHCHSLCLLPESQIGLQDDRDQSH